MTSNSSRHKIIYPVRSRTPRVAWRGDECRTALASAGFNAPRELLTGFTNAGHGTTMLERNPEFMDELAQWLTRFDSRP